MANAPFPIGEIGRVGRVRLTGLVATIGSRCRHPFKTNIDMATLQSSELLKNQTRYISRQTMICIHHFDPFAPPHHADHQSGRSLQPPGLGGRPRRGLRRRGLGLRCCGGVGGLRRQPHRQEERPQAADHAGAADGRGGRTQDPEQGEQQPNQVRGGKLYIISFLHMLTFSVT